MFRKRKKPEINLLDLIPETNYTWETDKENLVVVLIPKVRNAFLARWLLPRFKNPYYRLSLDEHGSFAWNQCNGTISIKEIADRMGKKFGEDFDPDYERTGKFFRQLIHGRLVTVKHQ